MAEYNFKEIEDKWQAFWQDNNSFKADNQSDKPKFYSLDMFPYPSGAGLHVGHPLGYIASDIVSRYKKLNGFNVLHPMGFDAFGLPAEQYAIQTGQHPAVTTEQNIARYKEQLKNIGFSFDWDREVQTCDPKFYKWTQWIFMQLFNSWYNQKSDKAESIDKLIKAFETAGNTDIEAKCDENTPSFSATEWKGYNEKQQQGILLNYRLAYLANTTVNWCPALGTVLSNDEVKDGFSERGGHPVIRKDMLQWMMRINAYSERLLQGLDTIDWPEPVKEMQRNWIGKSIGAEFKFRLTPLNSPSPKVRGLGGEAKNFKTANPDRWKILKQFARENRKNQTTEEEALWQLLRNKKTGYKIRRQHAIGDFIADFVCLSNQLVIEVDGEIHSQQQEYDQMRTEYLNELGFRVIRFKNQEVSKNIFEVVQKIKIELSTPSLNFPSPERQESGVEPEISVFTTRLDTIFGVSYIALAPEHELVNEIVTDAQREAVMQYVEVAKNRSERERMTEVKNITGAFTGAFAVHPFSGDKIPVWIADYVLAGYGTGAVMAVPAGDQRDYDFAKHFDLPIPLINDAAIVEDKADPTWEGKLINSDFLNGLSPKEAIKRGVEELEKRAIGKGKINYRMRDAIFTRQRYWGEPLPVYFKDDIPYLMDESKLPLVLPEVDKYLPTEDGEPPLARAENWVTEQGDAIERSTMPGWAGSSWYFFRYMDAHNDSEFAGKEALDYWQNVDLYIGGSEHATGHLLYSRFWTKFLYDRGLIKVEEPFKKLINQGMIQGVSSFIYRVMATFSIHYSGNNTEYEKVYPELLITESLAKKIKNKNLAENDLSIIKQQLERINKSLKEKFRFANQVDLSIRNMNNPDEILVSELHVDINLVNNNILNQIEFKKWRPEFKDTYFIVEGDGLYICGSEVEKMSKSKYNVVSPDDIVEKYGADTLRMYEMFLGPLEQFKPWNTNGIDGVFKFLRRFWNLFHSEENFAVSGDAPTKDELKVLHKTIKKVKEDVENYSFNTTVSEFMICTNELTSLKCNKRQVLEPLVIALSPYAPHIAEELWNKLGHETSITQAEFPSYEEKYLVESSHEYPVSINGKMRAKMSFPLDMPREDIEKQVIASEIVQKWLEGKIPKKVIVVPMKIVNIVL
jgi:leucyl-tRNA synthetase